jgi:hypothetical protein
MRKKNKKEITTISLALLDKMATTKRLKEILHNYIEKETIPSVRKAWTEYFFELKNRKVLTKK